MNNSILMWSYCDVSHQDINNIQVPLTSSGNELLIQYYSAKGSYDGQEFTYTISYRFIKKSQNSTTRRQVQDDFKLISLRPVNFSALNFNESENCNCDFGDRIGSFKNWFMVLVVLGIVSFLGAVLTIIALLAKCIKMRSMEKKLLQTPKLWTRSNFVRFSTCLNKTIFYNRLDLGLHICSFDPNLDVC